MMSLQRPIFALLLLTIYLQKIFSVRVISKEELAAKTSKAGDEIWLSIMGEVYDVSKGKEYYADGNGYSVFAGQNADVPFITGAFTEDEVAKSIETLKPEEIGSLNHWREFYEKEEKYPFIGVLEGDLYDKEGNPTELLKKLRVIVEEEKVKAEIRKKEREERIAARRKKRQEDMKMEMKEL